jgi:acyl-coenzyme A synthetase/AMP-(fatty) acid ligase
MASLAQQARAALDRPADQPVLEFAGHWLNWGDLRVFADGVAAALAGGGAAPDAPVALIARNRPSALAAMLVLLAQGRSISMIYPFQSAAGMARDLAGLEVAGVVLDAEDDSAELRAVIAEKGMTAVFLRPGGAASWRREGAAPPTPAPPAEPRIEILTSGTTGTPKRFALPLRVIEEHFLATPLTRRQGADPAAAPPFLLFFPLGNISGIYSTLPMVLRGQRIVLLERFSIAAWHDYVVRYRPAHAGVPPSFVQQIIEAGIPREDLSSIRAMGVGAAPLDPDVQAAFEAAYGIPILLSYGATEFAGPVAMMTADLHAEWGAAKRGTVGRALPGVQLRVVDAESGAPLPAGQPGLLEVVSPRMGPGWIRTSDLAVIDEDGFLFLQGRADGAIMRGGFKVLPEVIERALARHPAVAESAVVGIADARLGQVPVAAVRLKKGADMPLGAGLEAHLRTLLLATHIPARWIFCEEIPRNASLKTDRLAVRRWFEEGDFPQCTKK